MEASLICIAFSLPSLSLALSLAMWLATVEAATMKQSFN